MKKLVSIFLTISWFIPSFVSAHGIGEVYALPVPLSYYLLGAGLSVAFSFFIIAIFLNKKVDKVGEDKEIYESWLERAILILKVVTLFLLLLSIATGIFGSQGVANNFTPTFFWIYFLIGFGILNMLVGNVWDKVNPWKTITDWLGYTKGSRQISGFVGPVLILALFWLELVSGRSSVPRTLGTVISVYTLINVAMAYFYQNWYKDGELFSVLFNFIGNLAHFKISEDNKSFVVLSENKKLSGMLAPVWMLVTASVLLCGTSFDSLHEAALWYRSISSIGFSNYTLAATLGIILAPLPFLLFYLFAIWIMKNLVGSSYSTWDLSRRFVWSLVPIAFGYILAHNFSLVLVSAPSMLALVSDPFGWGWNLLGTGALAQTTVVLGAKTVWFIEITFIILAHIMGVLYAHILAMNIFKDPKAALKGQYPMVVLMIGFTVVTLWLLSLPLVVAKDSHSDMSTDLMKTFRPPPKPTPPSNPNL